MLRRPARRRGAVLALAAVALARVPHAAPGDAGRDEGAARQQFELAESTFAAGDLERALAGFRRAHELAPHGAVRFNIAVCLERLGRFDEAIAEYDACHNNAELGLADRERARQELTRLERTLGKLEVVAPRSARIAVDRRRCALPCATWVSAGSHRVSLQDELGEREREVVVISGESLAIRFDERAAEEARPARPSNPPSAETPSPARPPVLAATAGYRPGPLAYVGGSLVAAGGLTSLYFGLRTNALYDDYQRAPDEGTRALGLASRDATNVALGGAVVGLALVAIDWLVVGGAAR